MLWHARGHAYHPGYQPPDRCDDEVEHEDDHEGNKELPPPHHQRRGRLADPFQEAMIDFMAAVASSICSQNPREGYMMTAVKTTWIE